MSDTTEQRQSDAALHLSESKYRRLYESMMDAFASVDMDGFIREYNDAFCKLLGYEPEELLKLRYMDVTPEKWHSYQAEIIQKQVLPRGYSDVYEKEYRRKDGTIFPVELRTFLIKDDHDRPCAMWAIFRDITARKRAEEALRKSHDELEERVQTRTAELTKTNEELVFFRKFAEASGQGFGMTDLDGRTVYINPTMCRLIGEDKPEDAIGKSHLTYFPADWEQGRKNEINPAIEREGHWQGEQAILSRQGKLIPALHDVFLLRDEQGQPIRRAIVVTDITELKAREEILQQSEERFRSYFVQGLMGMAVSASDTQWLDVNDRLCQILGYSREELTKMKWHEVTHPEDVESSLLPFNQMLAGEIDHYTHDKRYIRKDGKVVDATIFVRGLRGTDGTINHSFTLIEDITERKRSQEALKKERCSLRHLLQSSDHERQLIAYEIHDELAQQLAGATMQFQTYDHLRDRKPDLAAKAYDAGMTMLRQSHFEARRLIAGVRPPILDEDGIAAAINHLVNEQSRLNGPKIEYRSNVSFDRLVPTLENAIYRIVQEGLTNACQHSKSDKVRVSLLQQEDRVRIEIRDWGVGFDTKTVRGDHFGLEGIRQRARLLGGKCSIRSTVGKGTRITVELPVVLRE